jgi:hypothetical protein
MALAARTCVSSTFTPALRPVNSYRGIACRTAEHCVCAFFGAGSERWLFPFSVPFSSQPPETQAFWRLSDNNEKNIGISLAFAALYLAVCL